MQGNLFIISAPSGAGKTTILKEILASIPRVSFSVSHTTRAPRQGEQHGADYFFVDRDEFIRMRDAGDFLEWAEVHSNLYGTSRQAVQSGLDSGIDLILDIDVQGARQIREREANPGYSIFIAPPSPEELEKRLRGRGTDSEGTIQERLQNAAREMTDMDQYDYIIINETISDAVTMLQSIIYAARSRSRRLHDGSPIAPAIFDFSRRRQSE